MKVFWTKTDDSLEVKLTFEIARIAEPIVSEETEKIIRSALLDELSKSPEYAEAVRKIALQRIVDLIESKPFIEFRGQE